LDLNLIIKKCLAGDPLAQKELYFHMAKRVFGICRRYSKDDQQAKDYMQDAFVRIFSNLKKYDATRGHFSAWVTTLVTNVIFAEKRKKKLVLSLDNPSNTFEIAEAKSRKETLEDLGYDLSAEDLVEALRQLPSDMRNVINLNVFEGWRHAEIAHLLGIEEVTSRSKLSRAKKMLKAILKSKNLENYEGNAV